MLPPATHTPAGLDPDTHKSVRKPQNVIVEDCCVQDCYLIRDIYLAILKFRVVASTAPHKVSLPAATI
jgi:hypothetical protein